MKIYKNHYRASKAKTDKNDVVVKITGGYTVMTASEYQVWRKQK